MDPVAKQSQKKLERVRPPRVHITYDIAIGDAVERRELPFEVLILADLSGQAESLEPLRNRVLIDIDLDNFDVVLRKYSPRLVLRVPNKLGGEKTLAIELQFRCLKDFSPGAIADQIEPLKSVLRERSELRSRMIEAESDDRIDDREIALIQGRIDMMDVLLSNQVSEIMHSPPFQRLEATWRGIHFLVTHTETGSTLRLKLLDASKQDLCRDVLRSSDFAHTALFKHVYEEQYGAFGRGAISVISPIMKSDPSC